MAQAVGRVRGEWNDRVSKREGNLAPYFMDLEMRQYENCDYSGTIYDRRSTTFVGKVCEAFECNPRLLLIRHTQHHKLLEKPQQPDQPKQIYPRVEVASGMPPSLETGWSTEGLSPVCPHVSLKLRRR